MSDRITRQKQQLGKKFADAIMQGLRSQSLGSTLSEPSRGNPIFSAYPREIAAIYFDAVTELRGMMDGLESSRGKGWGISAFCHDTGTNRSNLSRALNFRQEMTVQMFYSIAVYFGHAEVNIHAMSANIGLMQYMCISQQDVFMSVIKISKQ